MQPLVQEVAAVDVAKWKMVYGDLALKKPVGSGQFGVVMLACLKEEGTSRSVTEYLSKQKNNPHSPAFPKLVAVKRFRGKNYVCVHRTTNL